MSEITTVQDFVRPDYMATDPEVTADRKSFLRSVWHAISPDLELQYGIYGSTVAGPAAIFSQAVIDSIDQWRRHTQIAQLIDDTSADPVNYPYLEMFLENYRIVRKSGKKSIGLVRLLFKTDTSYSFAYNDTFTANGLIFRPTRVCNISPTGRIVYATNDQALKKLDDNTYEATIEMTSDVISPAANLTAGTPLVPANVLNRHLIGAVVVEQFVGGVEEDTLATLVPQMLNGITSTVMTSRSNIAAQLMTLPDTGLRNVSIVGAGDIESVRDKHGLFGISQGGRGDIYVRTVGPMMVREIVQTARRVPGTNVFRCALSREAAPAAYEIKSVRRRDGGSSLEVVHESRSIDLTGSRYVPDVVNYQEGAFSAYQTILLDFVDEKAEGDTDEYSITYSFQPNIAPIQAFCANPRNVPVMGDLLVKAATPCEVTVSFSVVVQQGQTEPVRHALSSAAATVINQTGFMNVLPGSMVIEAIQRTLPHGMFVSDFMMVGDLLVPEIHEGNGLVRRMRKTAGAAKEELHFDVPPFATSNTICFFADQNQVHVDIKRYKSMANSF